MGDREDFDDEEHEEVQEEGNQAHSNLNSAGAGIEEDDINKRD